MCPSSDPVATKCLMTKTVSWGFQQMVAGGSVHGEQASFASCSRLLDWLRAASYRSPRYRPDLRDKCLKLDMLYVISSHTNSATTISNVDIRCRLRGIRYRRPLRVIVDPDHIILVSFERLDNPSIAHVEDASLPVEADLINYKAACIFARATFATSDDRHMIHGVL